MINYLEKLLLLSSLLPSRPLEFIDRVGALLEVRLEAIFS